MEHQQETKSVAYQLGFFAWLCCVFLMASVFAIIGLKVMVFGMKWLKVV